MSRKYFNLKAKVKHQEIQETNESKEPLRNDLRANSFHDTIFWLNVSLCREKHCTFVSLPSYEIFISSVYDNLNNQIPWTLRLHSNVREKTALIFCLVCNQEMN